jgi:hypothetical protein
MVEVHIILELHQAAQEMGHQAAIQCSIILHLLAVAEVVAEMITLAVIQDLVHLVDQVVAGVVGHYTHNLVVQVTYLQYLQVKEIQVEMVQVMLLQDMAQVVVVGLVPLAA